MVRFYSQCVHAAAYFAALVWVVIVLGFSAIPVFAQDGEPAAATSTVPAGVGILLLLLGIGALLFVGSHYISQVRPASAGTRAHSDDEEDEDQ